VINKYPHYSVHWKTGTGTLLSEFVFPTSITGFTEDQHSFITLETIGTLTLAAGFVWDFGSGPAIDTPDMVYASLAHDALYELMQLGLLPWSQRKEADQYFKRLLKQVGMGWMRRQWVYAGVRVGYPIGKFFGGKGLSKTAGPVP